MDPKLLENRSPHHWQTLNSVIKILVCKYKYEYKYKYKSIVYLLYTLLGTNMSPFQGTFESMIFLFPFGGSHVIVPWRVVTYLRPLHCPSHSNAPRSVAGCRSSARLELQMAEVTSRKDEGLLPCLKKNSEFTP